MPGVDSLAALLIAKPIPRCKPLNRLGSLG